MAGIFHKRARLAFLTLGALGAAAAQQPDVPEGIDLSADSFEYDGSTNRIRFRGFRLSQGDLSIEAEEASSTSLESEHSDYLLAGNVRFAVGAAQILSEQAEFSRRGDRLSALELRGSPATFEDRSPTRPDVAAGGANRIVYDAAGGTLSLLDDAWLRLGANEVTGCDLIYDIVAGTFRSGSTECDQPFRIRIARPPEQSRADDPPPDSP
jgi:lipopolysaccharide transport protein LptA